MLPDQKNDEIHIRVVENADVTMSYMLLGEFNQMLRTIDEEMHKTLKRFAKNVQTKLQKQHAHAHKRREKRHKPKKEQHLSLTQQHQLEELPAPKEDDFFVSLGAHSSTAAVAAKHKMDISELKNAHFQDGMVIYVRDPFHSSHEELSNTSVEGDHNEEHSPAFITFKVVLNAPAVTSLSTFPKSVYSVDCPIVPVVQCEFADDFRCLWYCERSPKSKDFVLVSREKVFIPKSAHVGCAVKLFVYGLRFEAERVVEGRAFVSYLQHVVLDHVNEERTLNRMVQLRKDFLQLDREQTLSAEETLYLSVMESEKESEKDVETEGEPVVESESERVQAVESEKEKERARAQCAERAFLENIHRNVYQHSVPLSQPHNESESESALRIVCYNVLSDGYANQERDKLSSSMYYYIKDPLYLNVEYRAQRVAHELLSYRADVIALQECDRKLFEMYYLPLLGRFGYTGHYTNKVSMVQEGCAIFTKTRSSSSSSTDSLSVLMYIDFPLKNQLRTDPVLQQTLYRERPDLVDVVGGKLGTVAQILVCQYRDTWLVIGNTHLFYHPLASYIRLLQMQAMLRRMQEIEVDLQRWMQSTHAEEGDLQALREMLRRPYDDVIEEITLQKEFSLAQSLFARTQKMEVSTCGVYATSLPVRATRVGQIVLGDLNSTSHNSGVSEFLNTGKLSTTTLARLWKWLSSFYWGDNTESADANDAAPKDEEDELVAKLETIRFTASDPVLGPVPLDAFNTLSVDFINTTPTEIIGYSNFVAAFQAQLDYIYASKKVFRVRAVAPMAPVEVLEEEVALPNSVIPSDHLALIVDVEVIN